MAGNNGIDWSSLWKKDDWLGVWIGFLIIISILFGLKIDIPKFKWTTDAEFASFATESVFEVEKLIKSAGEKGDAALQGNLQALKSAFPC